MGNVRSLSFANWTDDQFKLFCCLAGCDYVNKLKKMGIKTAHKFVKQHKTIEALGFALKDSVAFSHEVDEQFLENLEKAWLTYKHQLVFDPKTQILKNLTPIASERLHKTSGFFLGEYMDGESLRLLVAGEIDPNTMQPFEDPQASEPIAETAAASSSTFNPVWQMSAMQEPENKLWSFGFQEAGNPDEPIASTTGRAGKRRLPWSRDEMNCNPAIAAVFSTKVFSTKSSVPDIVHNRNSPKEALISNDRGFSSSIVNSEHNSFHHRESKSIGYLRNLISDDQAMAFASLPESLHRQKKHSSHFSHEPSVAIDEEDCISGFAPIDSEISSHQDKSFFKKKKKPFFIARVIDNSETDVSVCLPWADSGEGAYCDGDTKENSQPQENSQPENYRPPPQRSGILFGTFDNTLSSLLYPMDAAAIGSGHVHEPSSVVASGFGSNFMDLINNRKNINLCD